MTVTELEKLRKELEKLNESLRNTHTFSNRLSLIEEFQKIIMAINAAAATQKQL